MEMTEEKNIQGDHSKENLRSPIPLIYEDLGNGKFGKDEIIMMLDEIEVHVEKIRKRAFQIEEERDAMFTTLQTLRHSRFIEDLADSEREDVSRNVDRIYARCSTIDINVRTVRDKPQEEALHMINGIIDNLITELQHDPSSTKDKCLSFMNFCTSFADNEMEDKNFEQALLGCTVDDQKRVRRRLQGLMNYIDKLSLIS